ncbi:MAG: hypothetical protein ACI9KE_006735, partial [Polyangiales bacterium]
MSPSDDQVLETVEDAHAAVVDNTKVTSAQPTILERGTARLFIMKVSTHHIHSADLNLSSLDSNFHFGRRTTTSARGFLMMRRVDGRERCLRQTVRLSHLGAETLFRCATRRLAQWCTGAQAPPQTFERRSTRPSPARKHRRNTGDERDTETCSGVEARFWVEALDEHDTRFRCEGREESRSKSKAVAERKRCENDIFWRETKRLAYEVSGVLSDGVMRDPRHFRAAAGTRCWEPKGVPARGQIHAKNSTFWHFFTYIGCYTTHAGAKLSLTDKEFCPDLLEPPKDLRLGQRANERQDRQTGVRRSEKRDDEFPIGLKEDADAITRSCDFAESFCETMRESVQLAVGHVHIADESERLRTLARGVMQNRSDVMFHREEHTRRDIIGAEIKVSRRRLKTDARSRAAYYGRRMNPPAARASVVVSSFALPFLIGSLLSCGSMPMPLASVPALENHAPDDDVTSDETDEELPSVADESFPGLYAQTAGFRAGRPAALSFTPDGNRLLFLRSEARNGQRSLYTLNVESREESVLLTAAQVLQGDSEELSAEERALRERLRMTASGITSYELSPDGSLVLVPLSGHLYIVTLATREVRELASDGGYANDPRFAPDGRHIACVRNGELYVIEVATGRQRRITRRRGEHVVTGLAEFVAQEEMSRYHGYWWSPDSRSIVYQETDTEGVETLYAGNPIDPAAEPHGSPYPRAGTANAKVRLGIVSRSGGRTRWVDWDSEQYPYLTSVKWRAETPLALVVQDRVQQNAAILTVDPRTGRTTTIHEEH